MKWTSYIACSVLVLYFGCQTNPYRQGERLYNLYCANCHMEDGNGLLSLYPPLNSEEFRKFSDEFPCIIRKGLGDTLQIDGKQYVFPMPPNVELNNVAIANIYNYIIYRWHPDLDPATAIEMEAKLESCE